MIGHARAFSSANDAQPGSRPAPPPRLAQPGARAAAVDAFASSGMARLVRAMIKARARRREFFKPSLFSDPAWDILLELFAAEQEGRRLSVSGAGHSAQVPATTALRWINALHQDGLLEREDDPHDARRSFLRLTGKGLSAMRDYLRSCEE